MIGKLNLKLPSIIENLKSTSLSDVKKEWLHTDDKTDDGKQLITNRCLNQNNRCE